MLAKALIFSAAPDGYFYLFKGLGVEPLKMETKPGIDRIGGVVVSTEFSVGIELH